MRTFSLAIVATFIIASGNPDPLPQPKPAGHQRLVLRAHPGRPGRNPEAA
jgi:hypothetical protein